MKRAIVWTLATLFVALAPTGSNADPLEDGTAAFDRADYTVAEKLLLPLAEQGDPSAEGLIGQIYFMGMLPNRDRNVGVDWLRKAAAGDDPLAEYTLGQACLQGLFGHPQDLDLKSAAMWFQKAAAHTDPMKSADAQLILARLYAAGGGGVSQSNEEARKWYDKAVASFEVMAGRGLLRAKLTLAYLYAHGEGVEKDEAKADQLYKDAALEYARAAEQGSPSMQAKLASLYRQGLGVPRDGAQAYIWLRRAADQGDASAMEQLSNFYLMLQLPKELGGAGLTDPENAVQACIWMKLAVVYGPPGLAVAAEETEVSMMQGLTDEQRARVEATVKAWRPAKEAPGANGSGPVTAAQKAELERLRAVLSAH